jgi:hypothetical protein
LFGDSAWHGQSSAEGETVMVAVDNDLDRRADRLLFAGALTYLLDDPAAQNDEL